MEYLQKKWPKNSSIFWFTVPKKKAAEIQEGIDTVFLFNKHNCLNCENVREHLMQNPVFDNCLTQEHFTEYMYFSDTF